MLFQMTPQINQTCVYQLLSYKWLIVQVGSHVGFKAVTTLPSFVVLIVYVIVVTGFVREMDAISARKVQHVFALPTEVGDDVHFPDVIKEQGTNSFVQLMVAGSAAAWKDVTSQL
mmetsp:Transcript_7523/g.8724  ORF Transcript_7523/g.8724 Transcript_7523/m.8724 type:complete len:115 (+) Transcript_7523:183-527(+)